MPRQRRKHHSRSRSRSHSHDKDRNAKRRKLELFDSPNPKRSVSPPIDLTDEENHSKAEDQAHVETSICDKDETSICSDVIVLLTSDSEDGSLNASPAEAKEADDKTNAGVVPTELNITPGNKTDCKMDCGNESDISESELSNKSVQKLFQESTPTRRLTPKQLEKKLESEKKRQVKEKEKEDREKQRQLEKEQKESEKQKKKELKQKEIEQKQKEKEEKEEQKKREKELKLKQKEEEKMRKQQEIDEKTKEKLKEEEKKQKAAAAFVSFFVPKKVNTMDEKKNEETISVFMPFEVKCDMKLPPQRREPLTGDEKITLDKFVENNQTECSYLKDLKSRSRKVKKCPRTWIYRDSDYDVIIVEEEVLLGETICEEKPKTERMRVKLLQFHENQRPAYYGTWRKKSRNIKGRRPWGKEDIFDYEVDSDDDWEEEEQGENLEVVSDEEKENEPEIDEYEVDNDFFVPHGHLSDDEVDEEESSKLSPESQKEKLKLLKDAFDQDIKSKTHKIKPRSIGCIWYNRNGNNIDEAIDRYLFPFNIITNGRIEIKKRYIEVNVAQKKKKPPKPLPENLMRVLAKLVHGNGKKREKLVIEFLEYVQTNNVGMELSKTNVSKQISQIAKWTWNAGNKTHRWIVSEDVADKYKIDFVLPDDQEIVKSNANDTM